MEVESRKKLSHAWLGCYTKCLPISPSSTTSFSSPAADHQNHQKTTGRKPSGLKAVPYVLGNETFERLATVGLLSNLMVFFLTELHLEQASAASILNVWFGVTNFAPLIGAFICDSYVGRFRTIAFSSFASFLGMLTLTIIPAIPSLHPPPCSALQLQLHQCMPPKTSQIGVLFLSLGFLAIGTGGIRPCSLPFALDQFDPTTENGRKHINNFFNWYYATFTVALIIALTLVVYIQQEISWVIGFGISTSLMFFSIVLYFAGMRVYVYVKPQGSIFSGIAQAFVVSYKKRHLKLPSDDAVDEVFYNPPDDPNLVEKLPLTKKFRFLDKAAITLDGDLNPDGTRSNPWRLCSIQQVEEAKCLVKVVPVWASAIIFFLSMAQQVTFAPSQALKMDRHLGPKFKVPPGSLNVISMITIGIFVPLYDRILVPALRKFTKIETGITFLQRIGIGFTFNVLSMVVSGLIEKMRRESALLHGRPDGVAPISVMWLAPQLILLGFAEAFNNIGQLEFYNKEFPENMKSVSNSLYYVTMGGGNYLSSLLIAIVHRFTKTHSRSDWLTRHINAGKIDYFYYLIAVLGAVNMVYFLIVSRKYQYKRSILQMDEESKQHAVT